MDTRIKILEAARKLSEQRAREFQNAISQMADEPGITEPNRAAKYRAYADLRDKWIGNAHRATELIADIEWQKKYEEWYKPND